jgi:hypothetical protein
MTQRSSVNQTTQIGVETVQGTAVAANKIIRAISWMPKLRRETTGFTPKGHRYPTINMVQKEHAEGSYDGIFCYNGLLYLLCSLVAAPTPAAIGAATLAKKWTVAASTSGVEVGKSYTMEDGDSVAVDTYPAGIVTSLNADLTQDEAKVTGDIIAQKPTFNGTQTGSPTSIPGRPVLRGQLDFFLDATFGAIGTTKITDTMHETITISRKKHAIWAHNTARPSWSDIVDTKVDIAFSFVTPHNSQSRSYLTNLASSGMQYFRLQATGPQIDTDASTPVKESIKWDIAGQFDEPTPLDEDDAYCYKYTFRGMHDDTFGGCWKAELINLLTAL